MKVNSPASTIVCRSVYSLNRHNRGSSITTRAVRLMRRFTVYQEMGRERSLPAVARRCTKSATLIRRWSSRWRWIERARGYDNFMARQISERVGHRLAEQADNYAPIASYPQTHENLEIVGLLSEVILLETLRPGVSGQSLARSPQYNNGTYKKAIEDILPRGHRMSIVLCASDSKRRCTGRLVDSSYWWSRCRDCLGTPLPS
jgi:hypothetical protein